MRNRHGLSRDIPSGVMRAVRAASGFGCVMCAGAIVDYEHVDPPFEDATVHDPACITLLCPKCHSEITRKFISKEMVKEAMKAPKALEQGFSDDLFRFGGAHPFVVCGGVGFDECFTLIQIKETEVLGIKPPESPNGPFRLNGTFHDSSGKASLQIVENQWRSFTSNWDVEATGGLITVRESLGNVSLRIRVNPGKGLVFEKIQIQYRKYKVEGDSNRLRFWNGSGWNDFRGFTIGNAKIAFAIG